MSREQILRQLYDDVHCCRCCPNVIPSIVPRQADQRAVSSDIVLMAQAPSKSGVRKSGRHWIGEDGKLRRPGGVILDKHLRGIGYTVEPDGNLLKIPYTTNVLHCWTGRTQEGSKRDRRPARDELLACKRWWRKELELVRPGVLILLGKPAAESFSAMIGEKVSFSALLDRQGETIVIGEVELKRFTLPHPTAPYRRQKNDGTIESKSDLYEAVFRGVASALR